jgi:uncharacterized membrane protein (DUF4010 family)
LISVVVLPVLPNRDLGPWSTLNPYKIWWLVVLVAAVSYVGYFAQRVAGNRSGTLAAALFGGMVSSTAVTLALSRGATASRLGGKDGQEALLAAGIIVASSLMFVRMLVVIAPAAPGLIPRLAPPLCASAIVGFAAAALSAWRLRRQSAVGDQRMRQRNPLDLSTALQFGLILATIMVVSRGVTAALGDRGVYLAALVGGIADVDAISLSLASMAAQGALGASPAVLGILTAAAVNTLVKIGIAFGLAGWRLGLRVATPMAASLLTGAAALFFAS